jgi:hypothetical protein
MAGRKYADVLDCSRAATCLFWFVAGAALALGAIASQGSPNLASLIRVGSANPALHEIQRELGPIVSPDRTGHDAQLYYLIARDPFARSTTVATLAAFDTNPPRYRYRRILFPLLAGGLGYFSGRVTLLGMIACVAIGMGLTAVAVADLAFQLRVPGWTAFLATANIGALLSAMILTADVLALGLALIGLALIGRTRTGWAAAALILSVLTKEVYLLVPLSLAVWQWRRRPVAAALVGALPAVSLAVWSAWVWINIPEVPTATRHFGLPMSGILESLPYWGRLRDSNSIQLGLAIYSGATVAVGFVLLAIGRNTMLRWVIAPWLVLACCSTSAVWKVPSNAARAYVLLWPVSVLLLAERWSESRALRQQSTRE